MKEIPPSQMKKKEIHEQIFRNGELFSERTYEVTDWDAYWVLDYEGNLKESRSGVLFTFDKEEYPSLEHAQNAVKAHQLERLKEQQTREAEAAARQKALRKEQAEARKARKERQTQ